MMTVRQVSARTGVTVRTLHHYDAVGLLHPVQVTEAGYRLYDDAALERLQSILLFRELGFSLREIAAILDSPAYDQRRALRQQIELLRLKKEHLDRLIALACELETEGVRRLDFSAFDTSRIDEYAAQAKAAWGQTEAYREYEEKAKGRTRAEDVQLGSALLDIFRELGGCRGKAPESAVVQALVQKLQGFITAHYYTCTPDILRSLGEMYAAGGSMTENIDRAGGTGTAALAKAAIDVYCSRQSGE